MHRDSERPLLQGKVALVTGASRGIGRALALAFAAAGAAVGALARSGEELERLVTEIESNGGRALALPADVTDAGALRRSVEQTVQEFAGLDIVLANAGISPPARSVTDSEPQLFRETLDVNLFGVYATLRAAIPHLQQRGRGNVIVVGSGMGHKASPKSFAKATFWSTNSYRVRSIRASPKPVSRRSCAITRWNGSSVPRTSPRSRCSSRAFRPRAPRANRSASRAASSERWLTSIFRHLQKRKKNIHGSGTHWQARDSHRGQPWHRQGDRPATRVGRRGRGDLVPQPRSNQGNCGGAVAGNETQDRARCGRYRQRGLGQSVGQDGNRRTRWHRYSGQQRRATGGHIHRDRAFADRGRAGARGHQHQSDWLPTYGACVGPAPSQKWLGPHHQYWWARHPPHGQAYRYPTQRRRRSHHEKPGRRVGTSGRQRRRHSPRRDSNGAHRPRRRGKTE